MKPLEPPNTHHLNSALGWLELGNHFEANAELENITPSLRSHPAVLEVRWQIFAKEKKWEACVDIGEAMVKLAFDLPESWINRSFALHELKRTQEAEESCANWPEQRVENIAACRRCCWCKDCWRRAHW